MAGVSTGTMSIAFASTLQPGIRACASPRTADPVCACALPCPVSPLVLAAVAGAFFALVLFLLTTINVPHEFVCVLAAPFARVRLR